MTGNRALQLRYRKVPRYESSADEVLSDPMPVLRRQLASPRLSFPGRQERDDSDVLSRVDEWRQLYEKQPPRTRRLQTHGPGVFVLCDLMILMSVYVYP